MTARCSPGSTRSPTCSPTGCRSPDPRSRIVAANPELQERELIKLQNLAGAIEAALTERGVADNAATLAAQAGMTVFHVAFGQWVEQDDPTAMRNLIDKALAELRAVTSG